MSDIIDRIDELVNAQLEQEDGSDHQEKCPHCWRDWHGLKITVLMELIKAGRYYANYSYADDNSQVVCDGSAFIGPIRPPLTNEDWMSLNRWLTNLRTVTGAQ